jgi:hypothetical protein
VEGAPGTPELWPIAALDDELMELVGVRNRVVWLSRRTLETHLPKRPEIGADEYAKVQYIIAARQPGGLWRSRRVPNHFILTDGRFRVVLKVERSGEWAWLQTMFRSSRPPRWSPIA